MAITAGCDATDVLGAIIIGAARKALYTGRVGDGKFFVYDVEQVVKVRTGELGYDALQGEE